MNDKALVFEEFKRRQNYLNSISRLDDPYDYKHGTSNYILIQTLYSLLDARY